MTVLAAGDVSPGVLGFIVVALIGFALYFLIKSMNKQMSKIQVPRESELDDGADGRASGAAGDRAGGTDGSDGAAVADDKVVADKKAE
ncbi:hypothetical protein GCM10009733_087900 [Nonomuraea maheshkhaliensis]|uniref:Preprotein translocase subunit YajC n=1 Tax=Nonomuraea maheshkhaliensis TaxID=419590 RepID=A0ABP4STE0_9ACTN